MNKIRFNKTDIFYIFVFFLLAIVYLSHAPHTVQTGDSGELSAAAFKLLVPHPPGYPLWVWLNHFWLNIYTWGSPYFAIAILNTFISLATLWVLGKSISNPTVRIWTILALGLSYLYWKFTELPEVFMLNLLLTFGTIYAGCLKGNLRSTNIPAAPAVMPLIFSLGIANHHTIIFLLPFVAWVCWQHKKSKWLYLSIATGIFICVALYISLLLMHPEDAYSWGYLKTYQDVLNHFLRRDYGTLALHPVPNKGATSLLLIFFAENLLITAVSLILVALGTIVLKFRRSQSRFNWSPTDTAILISILGYVGIFIPMMQMAPLFMREEMTERFMLFPISLFVLLVGRFISANYSIDSKYKLWVPSVFVGLTSYYSFMLFSSDNDFSRNTIVSDYTHNLLNTAAEFPNPMIVSAQDTQAFGLRYAQVVENVQPQIFVGSNFNAADLPKTRAQFPHLNFNAELLKNKSQVMADRDLIEPNEGKVTFITDEDSFDPQHVKITYLPVGLIISKGSGVHYLQTRYIPQFQSDISIIEKPPAKFDLFRNVFSKYTYFFMAKGSVEAKKGNNELAMDSFERALGLDPYNKHALKNLCKIKSELSTSDPKCNSLKDSELWFDYYLTNKSR